MPKKKIINFYNEIKEKNPYENPGYSNHHIKLPTRMLLVGASGSGKTNMILNFLKLAPNTFTKLIVCTKSADEPLYNYIKAQLGEFVQFYENGNIPSIEEFKKQNNDQTLVVFDDLVLDKKANQKIGEYFIRSRKLGMTCAYLSQSYFGIPKLIRSNADYIFLRGINSKRDLKLILSEYNIGVSIKDMEQIYKCATDEPFSFLLIDLGADENHKFRKGFSTYISL